VGLSLVLGFLTRALRTTTDRLNWERDAAPLVTEMPFAPTGSRIRR
jgi:hypothetical protein